MTSWPRLSMYARKRIRQLTRVDATVAEILNALRKEGISTCRQTVWRMQRHIEEHATIEPLPKSGHPTKLSANALQLIKNSMRRDDEATAKELAATSRSNGLSMSTTTALKDGCLMGWTQCGTA